MKIIDIKEATIDTGENRASSTMNFSEMTTGLVCVVTDVVRDGKPVVGFGFSGTGRYSQNAICRERLIPRILKADPDSLLNDAGDNFDPFKVWDCMMQREKAGGHGDRAIAVATIDMAVWDACAKIAGQPLYAFLAERHGTGTVPDRVPVYVGGGYYGPGRDYGGLQDEFRRYLDDGFEVIKMKIGGAPIDEDKRRIDAVLDLLPADRLAVDANARFELQGALDLAAALKPYGLRWFEEPGYPLDYQLMNEVAQVYEGPLACGECLLSSWDIQNLLRYGGMRADRDFIQPDCALSYGICEYIRIVEVIENAGWSRDRIYPHGGHLLSLQITAGLGFGGTECYPYTHQPMGGFTDGLEVSGGSVALPQLPGLGLEGKNNMYAALQKLL